MTSMSMTLSAIHVLHIRKHKMNKNHRMNALFCMFWLDLESQSDVFLTGTRTADSRYNVHEIVCMLGCVVYANGMSHTLMTLYVYCGFDWDINFATEVRHRHLPLADLNDECSARSSSWELSLWSARHLGCDWFRTISLQFERPHDSRKGGCSDRFR